jgi:A/G-specific adenine glycosylase
VNPAPAGSVLGGLRRRVLGVGRRGLRPFPWRSTRDPWAVLVSEVMLQQTQAPRVLAPYEAFMARFPTPSSCAGAAPGEVLVAWAGLGYNRRAVQLRRAAQAVVDRFGGEVPGDLDALQSLPGVGPYTARAVMAFAFERDVAVVDVNVSRVLCRAVAGHGLSPGQAQTLADILVPPGRSWAWNQSIMDIGASTCTARRPACATCPLRPSCAWAAAGHGQPDPAGRGYRQSAFDGSDRQGRGRLVAALRAGPVRPSQLAAACGWPDDPGRARRVAEGLVADGLSRRARGGTLFLP